MPNLNAIIISTLLVLVVYAFLMIFNKSMSNIVLNAKPLTTSYKIAVCISGEVRDLSNINYFIKQLVLPYSKNNTCDIFMHCSFRDSTIRDEYVRLLKPKVLIERKINSRNLLDIVYGRIYELHEVVKQYQTRTGQMYDLFIRTRPDIILSKPLTDKELTLAYNGNFCCTMILTSLFILSSYRFVSDTFFVANGMVMDSVVNIYHYITQDNVSTRCNNPESLLYNYLKHIKVNIVFLDTELSLTDYIIKTSKKKSMLKMIGKIKDLPLIKLSDCTVTGI